MNNNKQNLPALLASCKGVFSSTTFLNSGEGAKFEETSNYNRDSYKGKQFQVAATKTGNTLDTFFGLDDSKKHLYVSEGLPYHDTLRFAETQPDKPGKGFLTSDYNRRGEFTSTIRTEQYRAQLKSEEKIARKRREQAPAAVLELPAKQPSQQGFLYDRIFDTSRPGKEAQRLSRDTSNPTMLGSERHMGLYNTTYLLAHAAPGKQHVQKPEFARKAVVRDTFYEKDMQATLGAGIY